jgi:GNAT superfamily N-acetyltransferase
MVVVTDGIAPAPQSALRLMDATHDLRAVADLIALCFADTLDNEGRRYLQELRQVALHPTLHRWIDVFAEQPSIPGTGYVWEEDGRLVGSASLIPFFTQGHPCYLIANVAVHPDYRGRGIGKALTARALEHARQRLSFAAWLQVRDDNPVAIHIYHSLGFVERARRSTWQCQGKPDPNAIILSPGLALLPRKAPHWERQQTWLKRIYPAELAWHLPVDWTALEPGLFGKLYRSFNLRFPRQWAVQRGEELQGVLTWERTHAAADRFLLAVPEAVDEPAIQALLLTARQQLPARKPASMNLPAGFAIQALWSAGFQHQNTLVWMEYRL